MPSSAGPATDRPRTTAVRLAAMTTALGLAATVSGCGGPAGAAGGSTVTVAISADPGSLSPTTALASTALAMNEFAYDTLMHVGPDGSLIAGVAEKWTATPTSARFTIRSGVSCQDGSPLTATDVAAEVNHIADPRNQSPLLGLAVPPTAVARADESTRSVTVTVARPAPFLLQMTRLLPLLCKDSLAAPTALARASAASGPYRLSEAVPGDHYTYLKRAGYSWGPNGATGAGLPDKVIFKVVANESTAANLLLAGQINVAEINGPDHTRLDAAKLKSQSVLLPFGQFLFDEAAGHATADTAVRQALISVVDLKQLGAVATGGAGRPPTNLGEVSPTPCTGDSVTGNVPAPDAARAAGQLIGAGWVKSGGSWSRDGRPLSITLVYPTGQGATIAAAAELAVQEWTAFGVKASSKAVESGGIAGALSGGDWDMAWAPIGVTLPDQLTQFFDGPRPPHGNNFGAVANPDYHRLATQAEVLPGSSGCTLWDAADASLIKRADAVPFVSNPVRYYGKGATFQVDGGGIVPSTLRGSAGR